MKFQEIGVRNVMDDKRTIATILGDSVICTSNHFCTVSTSNRVCVLNTSAHSLLTSDQWIIRDRINVSSLIEMIVHANKNKLFQRALELTSPRAKSS